MHWLGKNVDCVISFGDGENECQFSGKNAVIKEININTPCRDDDFIDFSGNLVKLERAPEPVEVSMTFIIPAEKFKTIWQENSIQNISEKKVKDCKISELLFAVREKVRRGEDGNTHKRRI